LLFDLCGLKELNMTTRNAPPVYIVGDIHGQYEQLVGLLRGVGLVDERLDWAGGAALVWFIGDFFDRGPCGVESVDLVMRLQIQAEQVGGCVRALLGNHEPLILSARRFGEQRTAWGGTFLWDWRRNGGSDEELERLTPAHVAWLSDLPAMARVGDHLLVHADSTIYSSYGATIAEVNQAFTNNFPCPTIVMSLEVSYVLENHVAWFVLLKNLYDLMEQSPPRPVPAAILVT